MFSDEDYMREALRVARFADGRTSPNPLVGAVIVNNNRIIATGWHRRAGTEHAEIHAINMAGELAAGAVLYVTLEPCSYYGKMPPCVPAIIKSGIKRVVMAMIDPNPRVSGMGRKLLEEAGIEVTCGVLEKEARQLNEAFIKWVTTGIPFVTLKTAMTLDGKIATVSKKSQWITNEKSREKVHELRDCSDGILVGIGTVIADNPSLTARISGRASKNPVRIVVDSNADMPVDSKIMTDKLAPVIIAVTASASEKRIELLRKAGAEVIAVNDGRRVDVQKLLAILGKKNITSVLVEGGGEINYSFLEQKLADKMYAFISPKIFGGREALSPVEGAGVSEVSDAFFLHNTSLESFDDDICICGYFGK